MNKTVELLVEGQQNAERLSALSLIGRQTLVEGTEFTLGAEPAEIGYRVDGSAVNIEILIRDLSGKVVATINPLETGMGNHLVTWDGLDTNGKPLPEGKYSIMINAQGSETGEIAVVTPLVRTEINGVDLGEDGAILLTSIGGFPLSAIHGVYKPEG
jgi:flagellar basal-body rod modification protein FlgD